MPSALVMKLIGAGVGLLLLAGLVLGLKHYKSLAESRGEKLTTICQATREASGQAKLPCADVPAQVKFMGEAVTTLSASLHRQNAAVEALGAETKRQQAEGAKASQAAEQRAKGSDAVSARLQASSRANTTPCTPSKELEGAWR